MVKETDYTFQIITIGNKGVGKSSLLKRFVTSEFVSDYDYVYTTAPDCYSRILEIDGKTVTFNIFDTTGSEDYYSVSNSVYQDKDCVILTYAPDDGNSVYNISDWYSYATREMPESSIKVVVATKNDLVTQNNIPTLEKGKFLAKLYSIDHVKTSARTGEGIDALFTGLARKHIQLQEKKEAFLNAVSKNDIPAVEQMLLAGINKNICDAEHNNALHLAATKGLDDMVKYLIKAGVNIHHCNKNDDKPIHIAIKNHAVSTTAIFLETVGGYYHTFSDQGRSLIHHASGLPDAPPEMFHLLLKYGADVNARDSISITPLHYAAEAKNVQAIQILLAHGADINAQLSLLSGVYTHPFNHREQRDHPYCPMNTPLHWAVLRGNEAVCNTLLADKTIDITLQNQWGFSALYFAVITEKVWAIDALIRNGADVNERIQEQTPLHIAIEKGVGTPVLDYLLNCKNIDVNARDSNDMIPLHYAVMRGDVPFIRKLLGKDADINAVNAYGVTPLHLAVHHKKEAALRFLVEQPGIALELTDNKSQTPLYVAAKRGNLKAVDVLLAKGLHVNNGGTHNKYPLMAALENNQASVVSKLLEIPALNVACHDALGHTPLYFAVRTNNKPLCKTLLQRGAEAHVFRKGGTPLPYIAYKENHPDIAYLLLDHYDTAHLSADEAWKEMTLLHIASAIGHESTVRHLVEQRADINATTSNGHTPLSLAFDHKQWSTVSYLLEQPSLDISIACWQISVLHIAAAMGNLAVVRRALNTGNDINGADNITGFTPLHYAIEKDQPAITSFLLRQTDIDISIDDNNGNNALHLAAKKGDIALFRQLIAMDADICAANVWGNNVLHIALAQDYHALVNEILENEDAPSLFTNEIDQSALHIAATTGNLPVIWYFFENHIHDYRNKTTNLLHLAIENDHQPIVDYLLHLNANLHLDIVDEKGYTPLHTAIKKGNLPVVRQLLARGADINAVGLEGYTPLLFAIKNKQHEIVLELLKDQSNLQETDANLLALAQLQATYQDSDSDEEPDKEVSVFHEAHDDRNALILAAKYGSRDVFLRVIEAYEAEADYGAFSFLRFPLTPFKDLVNSALMESNFEVFQYLMTELSPAQIKVLKLHKRNLLLELYTCQPAPDRAFVDYLKETYHCSIYPQPGIKEFYRASVQHLFDDISNLGNDRALPLYHTIISGNTEHAQALAAQYGVTNSVKSIMSFLTTPTIDNTEYDSDYFLDSEHLSDDEEVDFYGTSSEDESELTYSSSYSSADDSSDSDSVTTDIGMSSNHAYGVYTTLNKVFFCEKGVPYGMIPAGMAEFLQEEMAALAHSRQKSTESSGARPSGTTRYTMTPDDVRNIKYIMTENSAGGFATDQAHTVLYKTFRHNADVNVYHVGGISPLDTSWDLQKQLEQQGISRNPARYEVFILPVIMNKTGHATAVVIDRKEKLISYIDPMISTMLPKDREALLALFPDFEIQELTTESLLQQHNNWACTIHSITNVIELVNGHLDLRSLNRRLPSSPEGRNTASGILSETPEDFGVIPETPKETVEAISRSIEQQLNDALRETQEHATRAFSAATRRDVGKLLFTYYQDEKTQQQHNQIYKNQIFILRVALSSIRQDIVSGEKTKEDATEILKALYDAIMDTEVTLSHQCPSPGQIIDSVLKKNPDNLFANKLATQLYWPESELARIFAGDGTPHTKGMQCAKVLREEAITVAIVTHEISEWSTNLMKAYLAMGVKVVPVTLLDYEAAPNKKSFLDSRLSGVQLVTLPGTVANPSDTIGETFYEHIILGAATRGLPLYGECHGFQRMAQYLSNRTRTQAKGETYDLLVPELPADAIGHHSYGNRHDAIDIVPGSYLHSIVGKTALSTDSSHEHHIIPTFLPKEMRVEATVTTGHGTNSEYTVAEAISSQATIPGKYAAPQLRATQFHSSYDVVNPDKAPDLTIHQRLMNERLSAARDAAHAKPVRNMIGAAIKEGLDRYSQSQHRSDANSPHSFTSQVGSSSQGNWQTRRNTTSSSSSSQRHGIQIGK